MKSVNNMLSAIALLLGGCSHLPSGRLSDATTEQAKPSDVRYSIRNLSDGNGPFTFLTASPVSATTVCLILFPGGREVTHFSGPDNNPYLSKNFLMRSIPQLARAGYRVSVPSKLSNSLTDDEDNSRTWEMLDVLLRDGCSRFYLIGTSRGTISAIKTLRSRAKAPIAGLVLTAIIAGDPDFKNVPVNIVTVPTLVVHHRGDSCRVSPFASAQEFANHLAKFTKVKFESIEGGTSKSSNPCAAKTTHGFWGAEPKALASITQWLNATETSLSRN